MGIGEQIDMQAPGAKDDQGKPDVSLIFEGFPRALLAVAGVGTFGANKYSRGGWQFVDNAFTRYSAAMGRHQLLESIDLEGLDEDSGCEHIAMVAWNALARLEIKLREREASKIESTSEG